MNALTIDELTERFYHVREQRNKLLWCLSRVADMAENELRRLGAVPESNVAQMEADARAVLDDVRANLSTPADDAEPVTEDWLRAVGFYDHVEPGWLKCGRLLVIHDSGKFNTAWIPPCAVYDLNTRGAVRRLCRCLGVPIR